MVKVLNTRAKTVKLLEEKHSCKSLLPWIRQWFLSYNTKNTSDWRGKWVNFIKIENLCFKEYDQENEDNSQQ